MASNVLRLRNDHSVVDVLSRVHFDFDSNAKFISCDIPKSARIALLAITSGQGA